MGKVEELVQAIERLSLSEKQQIAESVFKSLRAETDDHLLHDLQEQYPGEWLAVTIPPEEDRYAPKRGRLVAHSPEHSLVWDQVAQLSASESIYVFFNGSIAAKGFGVIFHDTTDTPGVATVGD